MRIPFASIRSSADDGDWWHRIRLERMWLERLAQLLQRQLLAFLRELRRGVPLEQALEVIQGEELRAAVYQLLTEAVDLGVRAGEQQVAIGVDWTLPNLAARNWAAQYSYELVRGIDDVSRRVLRTLVSQHIESGAPLSQLTRSLEPWFGRRRAAVIAATEITRAYAHANVELFRHAKIPAIRWNTAYDERVCPVCGALNGVVTPIGQTFAGGYAYPPAHPNCRCWITPVVPDGD